MPTPALKPAPLGRRSFNQSMAEWREGHRGPAPDTVWGARAIEALKPWEDNQVHLVMAVAQALEAAYLEGKAGGKPRMPDIREDLRPGEHAPAPVEDAPKRKVVRHAATAGAPMTAVKGKTFAQIHAEQQAAQPMKTVVRDGRELVHRGTDARPNKPREGTVAGYTRVIKEMGTPAPAPARRVVIRK